MPIGVAFCYLNLIIPVFLDLSKESPSTLGRKHFIRIRIIRLQLEHSSMR